MMTRTMLFTKFAAMLLGGSRLASALTVDLTSEGMCTNT